MNIENVLIVIVLLAAALGIYLALAAKHDHLTFKAESAKELAAVESRGTLAVHALELKLTALENRVEGKASPSILTSPGTTTATPGAVTL